jgi:TPR repeat protein
MILARASEAGFFLRNPNLRANAAPHHSRGTEIERGLIPNRLRPAGLKSMRSEDIRNRQWTEKERQALRRAAASQAAEDDSGINFEDIPRLTDEQLASMAPLRDVAKGGGKRVRLAQSKNLRYLIEVDMNIANLHEKAKSGSVVAQTVLGICYLDGIDVEVDYSEALRLLSDAARQGAPRAVASLGRMYAQGLGVSHNIAAAIGLFEQAAQAGEFLAHIELARIYANGLGVPINRDLARKSYSAALDQQARIGECQEMQEARVYLAGEI